jgi:hypothetical protein
MVDQVPRVFLNLHEEIPLAASAIILRAGQWPRRAERALRALEGFS